MRATAPRVGTGMRELLKLIALLFGEVPDGENLLTAARQALSERRAAGKKKRRRPRFPWLLTFVIGLIVVINTAVSKLAAKVRVRGIKGGGEEQPQPQKTELERNINQYNILIRIPVKTWLWVDNRAGVRKVLLPVARHPVPPNTGWMYVFGSGTAVAFAVQVITGVALATVYVASPAHAYDSLKYIDGVLWGRFVRGMHWIGASTMFALIFMHISRVYLTGSYKFPRELNWLTGSLLMCLTFLNGFTGQVLRWDQNGIWSMVVGVEQGARTPFVGNWVGHIMLGGKVFGVDTLTHLYAIHVFVVPGLIIAILGLHLYLVVYNGISEPPGWSCKVEPATYRKSYEKMLKDKGVPFWPDAAWRDALFAVLVMIAVLVFSGTLGPHHLDKPPNPSIIDAKPLPDWYLLWYETILAVDTHAAAEVLMILVPALVFGLMFAVPFISNKGERSPYKRPWAVVAVVVSVTFFASLLYAGLIHGWVPRFDTKLVSKSALPVVNNDTVAGLDEFNTRGCVYCHKIGDTGGIRGPDLSTIGTRMDKPQMVIQISKGGYDMPGYAGIISRKNLNHLVELLTTLKRPMGRIMTR